MDRSLSLRVLDDAAAAGALRAEPSLTRMRLLQRAVVGGGVIVAGGVLLGVRLPVLPILASARGSGRRRGASSTSRLARLLPVGTPLTIR